MGGEIFRCPKGDVSVCWAAHEQAQNRQTSPQDR